MVGNLTLPDCRCPGERLAQAGRERRRLWLLHSALLSVEEREHASRRDVHRSRLPRDGEAHLCCTSPAGLLSSLVPHLLPSSGFLMLFQDLQFIEGAHIDWITRQPADEPKCGFKNDRCGYSWEVVVAILCACGLSLVALTILIKSVVPTSPSSLFL